MIERFAPSPTGYLHLGHAFSALTAWEIAEKNGADFLLRIEDIDTTRARPAFEAAIFEDLHWLGLRWPTPVMRQSERLSTYKSHLNKLITKELCYPCNCSRRDIKMALTAPQEGYDPASGPDGPVYPGTCKNRDVTTATDNDSLRLNMKNAIDYLGGDKGISSLSFRETGQKYDGHHNLSAGMLIDHCGDMVLARRDIGTSYHLSVVIDDAEQDITHVTRGHDMFDATFIHRLLQALLALPTPTYHHHRLVRDENGKRLAKRDDARAIRKFRDQGATPNDIRALVGL